MIFVPTVLAWQLLAEKANSIATTSTTVRIPAPSFLVILNMHTLLIFLERFFKVEHCFYLGSSVY